MTLRNTLQVLSGPAWQVKVDEVARQVCFVLRPGYQLPPTPSGIMQTIQNFGYDGAMLLALLICAAVFLGVAWHTYGTYHAIPTSWTDDTSTIPTGLYGLLVLRPRGKGYGCSTAPTVILRRGNPLRPLRPGQGAVPLGPRGPGRRQEQLLAARSQRLGRRITDRKRTHRRRYVGIEVDRALPGRSVDGRRSDRGGRGVGELSRWHLALALAAGAISGVVRSKSGRILVVKGDTYKDKAAPWARRRALPGSRAVRCRRCP